MAIYVRPTKKLALLTAVVLVFATLLTGFIAYTLGQEAMNEHYKRVHMEVVK